MGRKITYLEIFYVHGLNDNYRKKSSIHQKKKKKKNDTAQSCWCTTWKNITAQAFCVCVRVWFGRLHSWVLKPQFQSTPINLKWKTIEAKDVLEQFSKRHSGAYKSKHNVLQSTTVNLKSTKESVSEKVWEFSSALCCLSCICLKERKREGGREGGRAAIPFYALSSP